MLQLLTGWICSNCLKCCEKNAILIRVVSASSAPHEYICIYIYIGLARQKCHFIFEVVSGGMPSASVVSNRVIIAISLHIAIPYCDHGIVGIIQPPGKMNAYTSVVPCRYLRSSIHQSPSWKWEKQTKKRGGWGEGVRVLPAYSFQRIHPSPQQSIRWWALKLYRPSCHVMGIGRGTKTLLAAIDRIYLLACAAETSAIEMHIGVERGSNTGG